MTYLPGGLDRAAGSAARGLLRWAGRPRGSSADNTWTRALGAEVDELETGLAQLAWAVGVVPLVLAERGAALGRRWRPRLLWLASAGGLGGLRVYGPALLAGAGMFVWGYANRDVDLPIPAVAAVVFAPFYVVRGLLAARRRSVGIGAGMGTVTAIGGFLVVTVGAVVYTGVTESWSKGPVWLVVFLMSVGFVAAVGALCGLVGAVLAHPRTSLRSLRAATIRSFRGR